VLGELGHVRPPRETRVYRRPCAAAGPAGAGSPGDTHCGRGGVRLDTGSLRGGERESMLPAISGRRAIDPHTWPKGDCMATEAYCVKCRMKRTMKDEKAVTMKNGKPATQGICPECGTKMFKIGKSK